jgi:hypothetical protein
MTFVQQWRMLMASNSEKILGSGLEVVVESAVSCKMEMCGKKQGSMCLWSMEQCLLRLTGLPLVVVLITSQLSTRLVESRSLLQASAQYVASFSFHPLNRFMMSAMVYVQVECCGKIAGAKLFSHPV